MAGDDSRLPALRELPYTLDARAYNQVRLALLRLGNPLRVALAGVGNAGMVLSDREWLCVDISRGDLPMMAWTDFEVDGRDALHAPVRCRLRIYHTHAGMLIGKALHTLEAELERRLRPDRAATAGTALPPRDG